MNIDLIAKLKSKEDFFAAYKEGDEKKEYMERSLIYFSLANHDLQARYEISIFLLNKNIDLTTYIRDKYTPLHVLLGQRQHNLQQTIELCKVLINRGVNINVLDRNNEPALLHIINMGFSDEELEPLYNFWFSQPYVDITTPNKWGYSVLDLAKKSDRRKKLVERMEMYAKSKS